MPVGEIPRHSICEGGGGAIVWIFVPFPSRCYRKASRSSAAHSLSFVTGKTDYSLERAEVDEVAPALNPLSGAV